MKNETWEEQQRLKIWQKCQAGHESHKRKSVSTKIGRLQIYDWEKYYGYAGYCTGQDDISMTLDKYGIWEEKETQIVENILRNSDDGFKWVIDIGSHIGWYSILAAKLGYYVLAIDGDKENLEVLSKNADMNGVSDLIQPFLLWIDKNAMEFEVAHEDQISLLKIDIEGNEQFAIKSLKKSIKKGQIKNIFMEVSPVFNDSYPKLVKEIIDSGYDAYKEGQVFDGNFNFQQSNLLFIRK